MAPLTLILVLASAVIHAAWNALIKRHHGSALFVWLLVIGTLPWLVLAVVLGQRPLVMPTPGWICVMCAAPFYCIYYLLLARAYELGELSIVYPISRGLGPALVALVGIVILREQATAFGIIGVALILIGILWIGRLTPPSTAAGLHLSRAGVGSAVGVGIAIAGYSLVDKTGVQYVPPEAYMLASHGLVAMLLAPVVVGTHGCRVCVHAGRAAWTLALVGGALNVTGYLLILHALKLAPASYVVPVRSVSILFAVLFGGRLFGEARAGAKLLAATVIVAGVLLIAARG